MTTTSTLARYVESHSIATEVRADGSLWGLVSYSQKLPTGEIVFGQEWEQAGSTMREVRDWLGY